ncbi:NADPH:quinone reductase-like Zn-dependent oxidoreductase [Mycetocola sp. CAN_C7]|uniref:NAD(P)-dependent alcohol dehydrogenase n=1 Tax=Mycetocola sp. CAN_C7 TaxID=2787724 RepID=UPI0018C92E9D
MRAAVYRRFGGPDVVRIVDLQKPTPRRDEILVRVTASTVSAADSRSRAKRVPRGLSVLSSLTLGFFRPRRRVLGMDIAGIVESVGSDVTTFSPGDEVVAWLGSHFGGHAEYALVTADAAITTKPAGLTFEEAAALVFGGITATAFLRQADLETGTTVLVNGASGAVGTAVVQLASRAGARVTAVCSGANAELVSSCGAERVIDYTRTRFADEATTYDVIVDCVGNVPFDELEKRLSAGGTLLSVVTDLHDLIAARRRRRRTGKRMVTGVTVTSSDLASVMEHAASGRITPSFDRIVDLADIADAHRYVDTGRKKGAVVVRIGGSTPDSTARRTTPRKITFR